MDSCKSICTKMFVRSETLMDYCHNMIDSVPVGAKKVEKIITDFFDDPHLVKEVILLLFVSFISFSISYFITTSLTKMYCFCKGILSGKKQSILKKHVMFDDETTAPPLEDDYIPPQPGPSSSPKEQQVIDLKYWESLQRQKVLKQTEDEEYYAEYSFPEFSDEENSEEDGYDSGPEYDYNNQMNEHDLKDSVDCLGKVLDSKSIGDVKTVRCHVIGPKANSNTMYRKGTGLSTGLDLIYNQRSFSLMPGESKWISLGVTILLETSKYWFTVVLRSHVLKHGVVLGNFPVIDTDYSKNVSLRLTNTGHTKIVIKRGTSFCQMVPFERFNIEVRGHSTNAGDQIDYNMERTGGFGSTGNTIF